MMKPNTYVGYLYLSILQSIITLIAITLIFLDYTQNLLYSPSLNFSLTLQIFIDINPCQEHSEQRQLLLQQVCIILHHLDNLHLIIMGQCYTGQNKPKFNLNQEATLSIHILPQIIAEKNNKIQKRHQQQIDRQTHTVNTQDSSFPTTHIFKQDLKVQPPSQSSHLPSRIPSATVSSLNKNQNGEVMDSICKEKQSLKKKPRSEIISKYQNRSTMDPQQIEGQEQRAAQTDDTLQGNKRKKRQTQNREKASWISNQGNQEVKYQPIRNHHNNGQAYHAATSLEKSDEGNEQNLQRQQSDKCESSIYSLKEISRKKIIVLPDDPQEDEERQRDPKLAPQSLQPFDSSAQISGQTMMQYRPASLLGLRQQPSSQFCCF